MSKFIKYNITNDDDYEYYYENENDDKELLTSYDNYDDTIDNIHKDILNYVEKHDLTIAEYLPKKPLSVFINLLLNQSE
jgi:hypothetical protein